MSQKARSPLGFGCAPVMGRVGKAVALNSMSEAYDLGVTHFDIARSYGFGRAEAVLGEFAKGKRHKISITSKFGVVPLEMGWDRKLLIPVVRKARAIFPKMAGVARSASAAMLSKKNFDVGFGKKCLDESLRELKTDYVDIYMLHEPDVSNIDNIAEFADLMEGCIRAGKVLTWGIACRSPSDFSWIGGTSCNLVQFEGNLGTLAQCGDLILDRRGKIVTRPFGGGNVMAGLESIDPKELDKRLRIVGASVEDLAISLASWLGGEGGTVVCSMFSSAHIKSNVASIREFKRNPEIVRIVNDILKSRVINQK